MTDKGSKIRKLARAGLVRYATHAAETICQHKLTTMQVHQMLKNCNHIQSLDDLNGYRVQGCVPASETAGTQNISAHIHLSDTIVVISTLYNRVIDSLRPSLSLVSSDSS